MASPEKAAILIRIIETAQTPATGRGVALYAISQGETVKIGISANPKLRMGDLQFATSAPLELAKTWRFHNRLAARRAETVMHELFASERMHGEWFKLELERVINVADELYHYFRANYRGRILS